MLVRLEQVISALQGTFANGSGELEKGIGTADSTTVKVKMPDGSYERINTITVEKGEGGENEVVITLE